MNVAYYPGCCMHGTAKGYDQSIKAVTDAMEIRLEEVEDWSCCGASSAHATNHELSVSLPARNLVLAEKGAKDVMIPCAACFNRLRSARHELNHDADMLSAVEAALGVEVKSTVGLLNPIDFFVNKVGLEKVREKVARALKGLKVASYYGCLLVRPAEVCAFDDMENPVQLDSLMGALGAEVTQWSYKTDCCGGNLTLARPDQVVRLSDKLMNAAREAGANCLVTACPECMANLDMRTTGGLPTFYFSELMAIAMRLPGVERWLKLHKTDPGPLLRQAGIVL